MGKQRPHGSSTAKDTKQQQQLSDEPRSSAESDKEKEDLLDEVYLQHQQLEQDEDIQDMVDAAIEDKEELDDWHEERLSGGVVGKVSQANTDPSEILGDLSSAMTPERHIDAALGQSKKVMDAAIERTEKDSESDVSNEP